MISACCLSSWPSCTCFYFLCRTTFYYFDVHQPTRLDTAQEITHVEYPITCLPEQLWPCQDRYFGGTYENLASGEKRNIFFYIFKKTYPASDMPDSKFGSHNGLTEVTVSLSEVLPSGLNQPSFKLILNIVPCPQYSQDVLKTFDALVHAGKSAMVAEYIKSGQHPDEEVSTQLTRVLSTLVEACPALDETLLYMQTVASAMRMPEGVINDSVIVQLRGVKEFRDMVLDGNKRAQG